MVQSGDDKSVEMMWTKVIVYSITFLLIVTIFVFAPKKVFEDHLPYFVATSMAITADENLLLYDYKVYGSQERFDDGLITDVEEVKLAFQERSEIVAVKIFGLTESIELIDDYILIVDSDTPELNIEYYLVKDMQFSDITFPCRTFIMLLTDITKLINNIYFVVLIIVFIGFITPATFKLVRSLIFLIKHYNQNKLTN